MCTAFGVLPFAAVVFGPELGSELRLEAHAYIPPADRMLNEIARVNRSSGRNQALQFDVTMRVGDRPPLATGQLISHPSGLARLELRGFNGRVDRYLLSGRELLGAKDGLALNNPQPLLQPLFLMQPSSKATLRAALQSFDVSSDMIGLAPCGEQDCFVIGDPRLAAPLPDPARETLHDEGSVFGDPLAGDEQPLELGRELTRDLATGAGRGRGALEGPELQVGEKAFLSRIWVDTEDLQVRRIDRDDGVFTIMGPIVSFDKLMVPAWFEVHEPGAEAVRFDVNRVVQVSAPATAFSRAWLLAPVDPPRPSSAGNPSQAPPSSPTPRN